MDPLGKHMATLEQDMAILNHILYINMTILDPHLV